MAKMYYSEEETCQKLGVDNNGLMDQFVNTAKLQMYQDGPKHVFKAADVDKLTASLGTAAGTKMDLDIDADAINLSELDAAAEVSVGGKEDTVITSEGISIFDDEDLQIDTGSALSDTAPAPNIDDEVALGGVGSGSGLLDLTRESDDTSLGADLDLLDNLDMEGMSGSGLGSGLVEAGETDTSMSTIASPSISYEPPTFVEAIDPSSGMFTGLLVGACVAGFICLMAGLAAMTGDSVPGYLSAMQSNMGMVVGVLAVFSIIAGGAGMVVGKAFQTK